MYAVSVPTLLALSLVINPVLLSIFISIHLIVYLKLCWNTLNFLNSDYLIMFIAKINKLDLNCTVVLFYLLYLTSLKVYKRLILYLITPLLWITYYITNLSDVYTLFNQNEFYITVHDLSLSNGAVTIHPVMILISYSLLVSLITSTVNTSYFRKNRSCINYIFKTTVCIKALSFKYAKVLIVAIFLGAYWAHQELNWGGYWSWDIVEIISLSILSVFLLISHGIKINPPLYIANFLIVLTSLLFFIVRLDIVQSIHGFLTSQSNVINMQYARLYVLIVIALVLFFFSKWLLSANLTTFRVRLKNYQLRILVFTSIFIMLYPLLVSTLSIIYDDSEPIKHQPFIVFISLPILWYLIDTTTLLNLILPVNESLVLIKYIINRRLVFFLRLYHLLLIIMTYYFLSLSHMYVLPIFSLELIADISPIIKLSTNYLLFNNLINDFDINFSTIDYLTISDHSVHYYFTKYNKGLFTNILLTSTNAASNIDKLLIFELMLQKLSWTLPLFIIISIFMVLITYFNIKRRIIFYY